MELVQPFRIGKQLENDSSPLCKFLPVCISASDTLGSGRKHDNSLRGELNQLSLFDGASQPSIPLCSSKSGQEPNGL